MRKRAFSPKQIQTLRKVLTDNPRDFALLNFAVDSCLRSSDILSLRVSDVQTPWGEIRNELEIKMKKTGKRVRCRLGEISQDALERWIKFDGKESDDFVFTSMRGGKKTPITSIAYRKIVKRWCEECGWDGNFYSTHSLRRTTPAHLYKQTKDLRTCQILLGHSSISSSAVYLGIEETDAFQLIEQHRI